MKIKTNKILQKIISEEEKRKSKIEKIRNSLTDEDFGFLNSENFNIYDLNYLLINTKMEKLPISILWKSIQIKFSEWGNQKINKVKKINWNEITDEKWNIFHINLEKVWSIFEPKSKRYRFDFDDFSDLKK